MPLLVLVAEDDADDRFLLELAAKRSELDTDVRFVEDGQALLDFISRRGEYRGAPRPELILLDLNMPRLSGLETLEKIKKNPDLNTIPVAIWTTSSKEEDIRACEALGIRAFVTKPQRLEDMAEAFKSVIRGAIPEASRRESAPKRPMAGATRRAADEGRSRKKA